MTDRYYAFCAPLRDVFGEVAGTAAIPNVLDDDAVIAAVRKAVQQPEAGVIIFHPADWNAPTIPAVPGQGISAGGRDLRDMADEAFKNFGYLFHSTKRAWQLVEKELAGHEVGKSGRLSRFSTRILHPDAGAAQTGTEVFVVKAAGGPARRPRPHDYAPQPAQEIINAAVEAFYAASPQQMNVVADEHPLLTDPRFVEFIKASPREGMQLRLDALQRNLDTSRMSVAYSGSIPPRKKVWKVTDPLVLAVIAAFIFMILVLLLTR